MKKLYDQMTPTARDALAAVLGFDYEKGARGFDSLLREIPELPAGFTIGDAFRAYVAHLSARVNKGTAPAIASARAADPATAAARPDVAGWKVEQTATVGNVPSWRVESPAGAMYVVHAGVRMIAGGKRRQTLNETHHAKLCARIDAAIAQFVARTAAYSTWKPE
ncbi:hypothetical protein H1O16_gp054 [Burkholderia phage BcepSaruman]|uniref:Uncharacterized protein n=1 Tax=Burkholderia phage BcepSaruman TaxID=2530032 RepID=A0A4D5ZDY5_9CAUD|nr:hypothetical protein H1O16_gp054 [Burkholderia phage BcepSaruman]QBX06467.1 hypothetical protein BcepSaruman_054 [Burkholderia phage BcepSaruman]